MQITVAYVVSGAEYTDGHETNLPQMQDVVTVSQCAPIRKEKRENTIYDALLTMTSSGSVMSGTGASMILQGLLVYHAFKR